MTVGFNQIQVATSLVSRVAFSGGEDVDPLARLALWRAQEGIDEGALERAAMESADDSVREIEERLREGGVFSTEQFGEYLMREYMTAFQVGWVARSRVDSAVAEVGEG